MCEVSLVLLCYCALLLKVVHVCVALPVYLHVLSEIPFVPHLSHEQILVFPPAPVSYVLLLECSSSIGALSGTPLLGLILFLGIDC